MASNAFKSFVCVGNCPLFYAIVGNSSPLAHGDGDAHRNRTRASKSHTRIEIAHAPGVHRNRTRAPTSHTHRVCVLHVLATRLYLQSNRKVVQESTNRSPTFCETSCETLATNPFFERIRRNGRERHENAKGANTAYQRPFFRVSRIMCIS